MATDETNEFVEHLSALFDKVEFDAAKRHVAGASTYGALGFLANDTLEMAYEECLDLMNYARYTAAKIMLLREAVSQHAAVAEGNGFISTSDVLAKGFKTE